MIDEIRQFVLDSLTDMNYSIDGIDDDTELGPAGADVESVALVELVVRVEDRFGVKFDDDESEMHSAPRKPASKSPIANSRRASSPRPTGRSGTRASAVCRASSMTIGGW